MALSLVKQHFYKVMFCKSVVDNYIVTAYVYSVRALNRRFFLECEGGE